MHTHSLMKRLLALFLVAALICSLVLLSSCAQEDGAETKAASPDSPHVSPTAAPTEAPETAEAPETVPEDTGETYPEIVSVPGTVTEKLVYLDDTMGNDDPRLEKEVVSCGDMTVTNRAFQIYYYMQYFSFLDYYGSYLSQIGLDTTLPLSEQPCVADDYEKTWEHFFIEETLTSISETAAVLTEAKANGFTLSEESQEEIRTSIEQLPAQAESAGYPDVDSFIQASFGPGVTLADYEQYLTDYYTMIGYEAQLADALEYTEDDIKEFFDTHPDSFGNIGTDHADISVRHILVKFADEDGDGETSDAEKAAAKAKAEEILAEYEKDPTEENFAALATQYSEDGGSADNGGLYDTVYPGQMVTNFNDWCFDDARKPGDTGIVETEYGYHVMYFVAQLDSYFWYTAAESSYKGNQSSVLVSEIRDKYEMNVNYTDLVIGAPMQDVEDAAE